MAKKKIAKKKPTGGAAIQVVEESSAEEPTPKKDGRGKKTCSKCGKIVGVRTAECPECHQPFPVRAAKKARKPRAERAESSGLGKKMQDLQTTAEFVGKVGGLAQARKMLAVIKKLQE
jgi:hypothetical protein